MPSEITTLIDRLNRELDQIEQEATRGLNLVRPTLSLFPDNAILMQFLATLSNVLFFVGTYKERIQTTVDCLSVTNLPTEEIQEVGEELATMLGVVLETKIKTVRIVTRLEGSP